MQGIIPALQIKDTTIFDLLWVEFHIGEFLFFPRLAEYLGEIAAIPLEDAKEIGAISELVYLYAKLHHSVTEEKPTASLFCGEVQMPILLGDLFLGRFYRTLAECGKEACLPFYLEYMKRINQKAVDKLQRRENKETDWYYRDLLVEYTADVTGMLANRESQTLRQAAANFLQDQWSVLYGECIDNLDTLKQQLQVVML